MYVVIERIIMRDFILCENIYFLFFLMQYKSFFYLVVNIFVRNIVVVKIQNIRSNEIGVENYDYEKVQ